MTSFFGSTSTNIQQEIQLNLEIFGDKSRTHFAHELKIVEHANNNNNQFGPQCVPPKQITIMLMLYRFYHANDVVFMKRSGTRPKFIRVKQSLTTSLFLSLHEHNKFSVIQCRLAKRTNKAKRKKIINFLFFFASIQNGKSGTMTRSKHGMPRPPHTFSAVEKLLNQ